MDAQNQDKSKGSLSPLIAAVTGAVIGAGAVVLKDKKNRDKIQQAFNKTKDQAKDKIEKIQQFAEDKKDEAEKMVDEKKEDAQQGVKAVKESVEIFRTKIDKK